MLVKSGRQNNNKQCESTHAYLSHLFLSFCRHVDEIWSSALLIKQCLLFWVEYLNCLSNIILISNLPRNICHRKQAFNFYGNIPLILKYNISITYIHSFSDRMLRGIVDFTGLSNNWRYLYITYWYIVTMNFVLLLLFLPEYLCKYIYIIDFWCIILLFNLSRQQKQEQRILYCQSMQGVHRILLRHTNTWIR